MPKGVSEHWLPASAQFGKTRATEIARHWPAGAQELQVPSPKKECQAGKGEHPPSTLAALPLREPRTSAETAAPLPRVPGEGSPKTGLTSRMRQYVLSPWKWGPKGTWPRHSASRLEPPWLRCCPWRLPLDHGALLRLLDALRLRGAPHARQPQPPGTVRLPGMPGRTSSLLRPRGGLKRPDRVSAHYGDRVSEYYAAHTHFVDLIEPLPPVLPNHWELGLSDLVETTDLVMYENSIGAFQAASR